MSNSTTIRVPKRDKERLQRLAKKTGNRKLSDAFRFALTIAERETDAFQGNLEALTKAGKAVRAVSGKGSASIDDLLAEAIYSEGRSAHD